MEEQYIENAQALIDQGQYEDAIAELSVAMKLNPENVTSRYLMTLIAMKQGEYTKAQSLLWKIVYIEPNFHDAQILLGQLYVDLDAEPDWAIGQADLVLSKDPNNLKAMNLKAKALVRKGDTRTAENELNNILQLDPDNLSANKLLVMIYGSDRAFKKALNLIDRILGKYPDEIDLYLLKVNNLMDTNNVLKAEDTYKTLLRKFPEEQELYTKFIEFYEQSGAFDKAEQIHRQLIVQFSERTRPKLQYISFLLAHHKEALAKQELKKFISNEPDNYRFQFLLASLYEEQTKQTVKLLTNIAEKNQYGASGIKARNLMAKLALKQGDKDRAMQLVGKVLKNDPLNPDALLIRSGLLLAEEKYSAALGTLRTMLRDNPDSEEAWMLLADVHTNTQQYYLAKEAYAKILRINPENVMASDKMANLRDKY